LIKTVYIDDDKKEQKGSMIKRFTLNEFLDQYLLEVKESKECEREEEQRTSDFEAKREEQLKLKSLLSIRTFDEIQEQMSARAPFESLCQGNPSLLMNGDSNQSLLKTYFDSQSLDYISLKVVTERQLIFDVLLLFQRLESPTFAKQNGKKYFTPRLP